MAQPKKQPQKKASAETQKKLLEEKSFGVRRGAKFSKLMNTLKKQADIVKETTTTAKPHAEKKFVQKVPIGVDPKTVECVLHEKNECKLGEKCKFKHTEKEKMTVEAVIATIDNLCLEESEESENDEEINFDDYSERVQGAKSSEALTESIYSEWKEEFMQQLREAERCSTKPTGRELYQKMNAQKVESGV